MALGWVGVVDVIKMEYQTILDKAPARNVSGTTAAIIKVDFFIRWLTKILSAAKK